jgi:para-nitrobenzyl esterase
VVQAWHKGTSEDCLFLNIWTSATATKSKLPVMVWIHGGLVVGGSGGGNEFTGSIYKTGCCTCFFQLSVGTALDFFAFQRARNIQKNLEGNYAFVWIR